MRLVLAVAASVADAGIRKKILESGAATLLVSNEEMGQIQKIVGLFIKYINQAIKNKANTKQKVDLLAHQKIQCVRKFINK